MRYIFYLYFDIWTTLQITYISTKLATATADSTPHSIYSYYQLWAFIYSSATNLKNADKLKLCAFAFIVRRSFSVTFIDTRDVSLLPSTSLKLKVLNSLYIKEFRAFLFIKLSFLANNLANFSLNQNQRFYFSGFFNPL